MKEKQSGTFSLQTAIPTATIDTINSRTSDRCPICKKWIQFCPWVIDKYSNLDEVISKVEVRCLEQCDRFKKEEIIEGKCPHTKFSRKETKTGEHTKHPYADGKHYHYQCVLGAVSPDVKSLIFHAYDSIALKTHFPYYAGLEGLKAKETDSTKLPDSTDSSDSRNPGETESE